MKLHFKIVRCFEKLTLNTVHLAVTVLFLRKENHWVVADL